MPLTDYVENVLTSRISANAGKGRKAIEWVIAKIEAEMKELRNSAITSTDEILTHTRKSLDGIAQKAKQSMETLANELPPDQTLPKF